MKNSIEEIINNYKTSLVHWTEKLLSIKKNDATSIVFKNLINNACEVICEKPQIYHAVICKLKASKNDISENGSILSPTELAINLLEAENFSQQLIKLGNKQYRFIEDGDFTSFIKTENFILEVCGSIPCEIAPLVKENIETKITDFESGIETMDCTGATCAMDSLKTMRPEIFIKDQFPTQN